LRYNVIKDGAAVRQAFTAAFAAETDLGGAAVV
jgi:hypothetical protein